MGTGRARYRSTRTSTGGPEIVRRRLLPQRRPRPSRRAFARFKIAPFDDVTPQDVDTTGRARERVRQWDWRAQAAVRDAIGAGSRALRRLPLALHARRPRSPRSMRSRSWASRWFECPLHRAPGDDCRHRDSCARTPTPRHAPRRARSAGVARSVRAVARRRRLRRRDARCEVLRRHRRADRHRTRRVAARASRARRTTPPDLCVMRRASPRARCSKSRCCSNTSGTRHRGSSRSAAQRCRARRKARVHCPRPRVLASR